MIIFAWKGFPQYAARCVGAFVKATTEEVVVVATRPRVPVEGMEKAAGCPVEWIEESLSAPAARLKFEGLGFEGLRFEGLRVEGLKFDGETVLVVSGWSVPAFNVLRDRVRAGGGRVYCMNDANYLSLSDCSVFRKFDLVSLAKQWARGVLFRVKYRKPFDGFLVPGKSGRQLLQFYGVPDEKIAEGMYSADESLFDPTLVDAAKKEKRIVYVGQYIDRKNVLAVCRAFEASGIAAQGWSLEMYGSGPMKDQIPYAQPFVQPEYLPEIYRRAKAFILASKEEHWGLVVHEAALSGCYLMLSNRVGAADDLLGGENGVKFDPFDLAAMTQAFRVLAQKPDVDWRDVCDSSLDLARRRGLAMFVGGVNRLMEMA